MKLTHESHAKQCTIPLLNLLDLNDIISTLPSTQAIIRRTLFRHNRGESIGSGTTCYPRKDLYKVARFRSYKFHIIFASTHVLF